MVLHRLPALTFIIEAYIIIHAKTIACYPSTINRTLHLRYVNAPQNIKQNVAHSDLSGCYIGTFIQRNIAWVMFIKLSYNSSKDMSYDIS